MTMNVRTVLVCFASLMPVAGSLTLPALADETSVKIEKECEQWAASIKIDQPLTEKARENAQVVPPGGAVIANYVSGRRTIWLNKNNRIGRVTCG